MEILWTFIWILAVVSAGGIIICIMLYFESCDVFWHHSEWITRWEYFRRLKKESFIHAVTEAVPGLALWTCLFLVCGGLTAAFAIKNSNTESTTVYTGTEYIVGMQDNNISQGTFYIRRGQIDTDIYYQYMVKIGDNSYVQNKIKADTATVHYTTDAPMVKWYRDDRYVFGLQMDGSIHHEVYIPEGSIQMEYSINMKD